MATPTIIPGNRAVLTFYRVSGDPYVPSDHRVQIVLDGPTNVGRRVRIAKVFDPAGGSDSGVSASGGDVVFELTPAETATMAAAPGMWQANVSVGPADSQDGLIPARRDPILVDTPNAGAVPHG